MRNQDIFLDFTANPSLGDALSSYNVGDTCKLEIAVQIKSKDDKGISGVIQPDSIVPEGYEKEEGSDDAGSTPAPVPPGGLAVPPVTQVMQLRKKGEK